MFVTEELIAKLEMGVGEDGFMLGLFAGAPGKKRNQVAARFGNVTLLAHRDEPIDEGRPAHLFDMRSRSGFSGSPVFVYRTPDADLRDDAIAQRQRRYFDPEPSLTRRNSRDPIGDLESKRARREHEAWLEETDHGRNVFFCLLGIHVGQMSEPVKVRKVHKRIVRAAHDIIRDGDELRMGSSLAIVAPAWEIAALLRSTKLAKQRKEREMRDAN
jgi:hypothetical protein